MPIIIEVNCETGEVVEREMTAQDQTLYETMTNVADSQPSEQEMLKQSAKNKLTALGLSVEEITALIGN
jgi:hypothetical protein